MTVLATKPAREPRVSAGTLELTRWLDWWLDAGMPDAIRDDRPDPSNIDIEPDSRHAPDYTDGSDWHYPRGWVDQ